MAETKRTSGRFFAWVRVFTGKPVARAYVRDRLTGAVVAGCPHRHHAIGRGLKYRSATSFAQRCADKMLRKHLIVIKEADAAIAKATGEAAAP